MNQDYEAKFKVGDKIRLYGKETTIRGFYISYNDALNKYETIMLTDGRGDPFERSLDAIEYLDESINQDLSECSIACDWPKCTKDNCVDKNINQEGSLKDSDWKELLYKLCYSGYLDSRLTIDEAEYIIKKHFENVIAPLQNKKVPKDWGEIKRLIIEFMGEEFYNQAIAPLLQNEYEGDDLVAEASVDEYQLMKDLVDKRVQDIIEQEMPKYKLGDIEVSEGKNAYYLSCKQTAEALLDKYKIVPLESNTSSQTLTQIEQDKKQTL